MNLGQLIRMKRKEKKLTQGEVAKIVGVSTNTISKYERNIIFNMGRSKVIALSQLLDIPTIKFIEAIDSVENQNIEKVTPDEFKQEVISLLNKTTNLTEQEKQILITNIEFICSDK